MTKQFKLLKQIELNNSIKVWDTFEIYDDYVRLDNLWKLHYTRFVTHWYIEEVKYTHFWNWMVDWWSWHWLNTTYNFKSNERYRDFNNWEKLKSDWSNFQTKEQAEQFDKMMMTVWKIWKWKRENDDIIHNCYYVLDYFSYRWKFRPNAFDWNSTYNFLLPVFSSREIVNQLISDLWEELNNLLCWIK